MARVADRLEPLLRTLFCGDLPVRVRGWDGSEVGPTGAPTVVLRSRRALRHLLWSPGELGLARAYVCGDLDVDGDIAEGLRRIWASTRTKGVHRFTSRDVVAAGNLAVRLGVVGPRPAAPAAEARLSGGPHTRRRDRAAIAHHYDLSNEFYALVLDPQLAYSCAYWTKDPADPDYGIEDAQRDKLDLVCRKLGLEPGMRFLDVGCGWGALILHAAEHYGVHATGVTLSAQQLAFVTARIAQRGLSDRVEVRLLDYREIDDGPYDRIASLEMGEHVGLENYPTYCATLYRLLKPTGRLLLHQMSRGSVAPGGGAFIESYVAPDMQMRPVAQTAGLLSDAGFEVRDIEALREHYIWTVAAWYDTLEREWDRAVELVGEQQARVWRLYLIGGMLAFAEGRMGVDQILAVRRSATGEAAMPRVRPVLLRELSEW